MLRAFDTEDGQGPLDVPDGSPDRGRPDGLHGRRRQGVPRDLGRRHADVVERRHRVAAPGLRDRRLAEAVAAAGPRSRTFQPAAAPAPRVVIRTAARRARTSHGRGKARQRGSRRRRRSRFACGARTIRTRRWSAGSCSSAASRCRGRRWRSTTTRCRSERTPTGSFYYRVDTTIPRRHVVHVVRLANATVNGRALTAAERTALIHASGAFNVGYRLSNLRVSSSNGHVVLTGRISLRRRPATPARRPLHVPPVRDDHRRGGHPVAGATVVTRTQDRNFWTFSTAERRKRALRILLHRIRPGRREPCAAHRPGRIGGDLLCVAGRKERQLRRAAQRNDEHPAPGSPGAPLALPTATSYAGAIYEGLIVGVSGPSGVVTPVSATWPTTKGDFRLVLPGSVRGKPLRLWEEYSTFFQSSTARPGGAIELSAWPHIPPGDQPQGLAVVQG